MTFHCPHCQQPIDPALIRKAANSDAGSRPRPGASGLVRNGCKHIPSVTAEGFVCRKCARAMTFAGGKWRLVRKQKSPAD